MELFLSVLACLVLARVEGETCTKFAKACRDDPYIARIVCDDEACKCLLPNGDEATGETGKECPTDMQDLTGHTVSSDQCRKRCEEYLPEKTCKYFRWEQDSVTDSHCTLMQTGECADYLQCEGEDHCVSEQLDCNLTEPPTGDCPGGSLFSQEHGAVHWTCYDPYQPEEYVSIYSGGDSATVPAGTICWTEHRCVNFDNDNNADKSGDIDYRNLVAECKVGETKKIEETDPTWVKYKPTSNDLTDDDIGLIDENGKLKDATCLPEQNLELEATKLVEVGVSFICSELDLAHYDTESKPGYVILKKYNHCILLCNFHTVMTIEPKVAGDGNDDPKWWMYLADGTEKEVKPDDVKCWD